MYATSLSCHRLDGTKSVTLSDTPCTPYILPSSGAKQNSKGLGRQASGQRASQGLLFNPLFGSSVGRSGLRIAQVKRDLSSPLPSSLPRRQKRMMKTGNGQQGERAGMGSKSFTFGVSGVTPIFRWDPILGSSSLLRCATNRAEVARRSSKKQEALRFLPTLLGGVPLSNHVGRFNRLLLLFHYSDRRPKSLGGERGAQQFSFFEKWNFRPPVRPSDASRDSRWRRRVLRDGRSGQWPPLPRRRRRLRELGRHSLGKPYHKMF